MPLQPLEGGTEIEGLVTEFIESPAKGGAALAVRDGDNKKALKKQHSHDGSPKKKGKKKKKTPKKGAIEETKGEAAVL